MRLCTCLLLVAIAFPAVAAGSNPLADCPLKKADHLAGMDDGGRQSTLVELVLGCKVPDDISPQPVTVMTLGTSTPATVVAVGPGSLPTRVLLRVEGALDPEETYFIRFPCYSDADSPHGQTYELKGNASLTIRAVEPKVVFAQSLGTPLSAATSVAVSVNGSTVVNPSFTLSGAGLDSIRFSLPHPLNNKDKVKITAMSSTAAASARIRSTYNVDIPATKLFPISVTAEGKADFASPASFDEGLLGMKLTLEAGRDQKPNAVIELQLNGDRLNARSSCLHGLSCAYGPMFALNVATQDAKGTNKGSLGYGWRFVHASISDTPVVSVAYEVIPKFEGDKAFSNRNGVADLKSTLYFGQRDLGSGAFAPRIGVGFEGGKNFGLEKKLVDLKNYNVARAKGEAAIDYGRDIKGNGVQKVTVTLDWIGRKLFSSEIDTVSIPRKERVQGGDTTRVTKRGGIRSDFTAAVNLKLQTFFSIEAKYENGKTPLLYERVNKVTLAFKYSI